MSRRPATALAIACGAVVGLAGCGLVDTGATPGSVPEAGVSGTVGGVGVLPDPVSADVAPVVMIQPPVDAEGNPSPLIGDQVGGNRILLIGDSILASTSQRYGRHMCEALVPLGWQTQVEAEPSRFIDFGNRVLDRLLPSTPAPDTDWHAAVVFLGSNYGGDEVRYEAELRRILDRLAPRPVVLLTVTEYRPEWAEVNEVVRRLADEYDYVTLLDWEAIARTPGVLSADRLHPTEQGRGVLAASVATVLGQVGVGDGACLRSQFRDDSAISGDRTPILGPSSPDPPRGTSATSTTTTEAVAPVTTLPPTTLPSTTVPPTTVPPTTAPPTTLPGPTTTPPPGP